MHEHVALLSTGVPAAFPFLYDRSAIVDQCVRTLERIREAGVDSIVDVTTATLGRDIGLIGEVARRSDVNIIAATGMYLEVPRYFQARRPDDAASVFIRELERGIGDTKIRAGIIKVASNETVNQYQEIVLRGAARASVATGAPITTHTDAAYRTGLRQLEILGEEGVDPSRIIIGHSITFDVAYLELLYKAGCTVGWDHYFWPERLPVSKRDDATTLLRELTERGYASQTVLSHDGCLFTDFGEPPQDEWTYIPRVVLPLLRELGTSDADIDEMTVHQPARLLDWA